ncbi:MAG: LPS export ABC transporter permease LptG [Burkholderiales bacterium]|nr:LPS export ABC transporter permease LptG [Burkholderiales bacterium]
MRILTRYLAVEVTLATALVLAALIMLFGFFDFIHELGDLNKGNYRLGNAVLYVLLNASGNVYNLFPVAALIGTLFALSRLASHSELTVMRISGLSLASIARSLMVTGLGFVLLTLLFGELITPSAERYAQEMKVRATEALIGQEFRSGVWVKDEGSFVNVREVHLNGAEARLVDVRIYEFDTANRLKTISLAKRGTYLGDNRWRLEEVEQTVFSETSTTLNRLPEAMWKSVLKPDILSVLLVVPEQMSAASLYTYIQHLRDNAQRATRYEIAIWTKLVYPAAVPVMMLLAVPFSASQPRGSGVGTKIFIGILLGLAFNMINRLSSSLGQLNGISPFLSAWLPTLVFLGVAIAMLAWAERRTSSAAFWGHKTA